MRGQYIDNVRQHYLNPKSFNKWIYQNKATFIDIVDGVLLDNFLVMTKNGYAIIYEYPVNTNMSTFYVLFLRKPKVDDGNFVVPLFQDWADFKVAMEELYEH